jgi:hypothetical protein
VCLQNLLVILVYIPVDIPAARLGVIRRVARFCLLKRRAWELASEKWDLVPISQNMYIADAIQNA